MAVSMIAADMFRTSGTTLHVIPDKTKPSGFTAVPSRLWVLNVFADEEQHEINDDAEEYLYHHNKIEKEWSENVADNNDEEKEEDDED